MEKNLADKQWYIVTTYSMNEAKTADNLKKRIESMDMQDFILQVIVAEQEEPVVKDGIQQMNKDGTPKVKMKNLYPGYIFVEMVMTDESWYIVRNTPGVTGIAGSSGGGQKPSPVSREEIEPVLKRMGIIDDSMYERYNVGDKVKLISGPLEGTEGTITAIDRNENRITVETLFFGRATPVDCDFSEIERI